MFVTPPRIRSMDEFELLATTPQLLDDPVGTDLLGGEVVVGGVVAHGTGTGSCFLSAFFAGFFAGGSFAFHFAASSGFPHWV